MLRVPREMEVYRRTYMGMHGDNQNGAFQVPSRGLFIIASSGEGWDHVSVSLADRTPTWDEMEWVRRKFFLDDDTVIQIHPPLSEYVNVCENCLHMWRPWNHDIPLPPRDHIA